jgi:phospholipid transport system substrate-binding protein
MKMARSYRRALAGLLVLAGPLLVPAALFAQPRPKEGSEQPAQEKTAEQVIRDTIDAAFKVLLDASLKNDPEKRMRRLREVVDPAFDWEAMARSSLGPHWRELDDKQKSEFVTVFKELLARQYMSDIDRFQGSEKVLVKSSEKRGDLVVVKTLLITASNEQVPIDYTLHNPNAAWRVEDVAIEGVSLVEHYRTTLGRFLVNNNFAALLPQLKRKLGLP